MLKSKIKVLLVEDDEEDYLLIRDSLRDVKYTRYLVHLEKTVDHGLRELKTGSYDICIVDHHLGIKTGLDLIYAAKDENIQVPIILLTGERDPELDFEAMKAGAADYLDKNTFEKGELERSIRYAIREKSMEEERLKLLRAEIGRYEAEEARKRVSDILESITDAFFSLDQEWRFIYVNKRAEILLRKKANNLLGKKIWDEFRPAVGSEFQKYYEQVMKDRIQVDFESYYPPLKTWFHVHTFPSKEGISVYFSDITRQKKVEMDRAHFLEDLEIERSFTDEVLRQMPVGVMIVKAPTEEIIRGNRKMESIFKAKIKPGESITNYGKWRGYHADGRPYRQSEYPLYRSVNYGETVTNEEVEIVHDDGERAYISMSSAPIRNAKGEIVAGVVVDSDMTERKRIEKDLRDSEEKFRVMADSIPLIIWTADPDGNVDFYNKRVKQYEGFSYKGRKEGWEWNPALHPDDRKKTEKSWNKAVKKGVVYEIEHRVKSTEGGYRWLLSRAWPVKDQRGRIIKWFGSATDINDHKLSEEKLRQQAELINRAHEAIIVQDATNRVTFWNKGAEEMYGWKESDVKGKLLKKMLKTKFPIPFIEIETQLFEHGRWEGEIVHTTKDGRRLIVDSRWVLIRDVGTGNLSYLEINRDITQNKELEQRKDEFIGLASHELKTPVTTIKAFTQLLTGYFSRLEDKKAVVYLARMDKQINRLTKLINELLDISRIQSGKFEMTYEKFTLRDLVDESLDELRAITDKKIINKGDGQAIVTGDRYRLSQVISNVVNNAIKYSPESDKIIVSMSENEENAIISIKDFGIGIPKEKHQKIFERFYRIEDVRSHNFPGLGLGLYLSRQILKKHQGRIWVESEPGRGSTFFISIPKFRPARPVSNIN